jgi:hypothetical protein
MWFSSSPIGKSEARQSEFGLLYDYWVQHCSTRAATALARAGCRSLEEVAAYGRIPFGTFPNTGKTTLEEMARLLASNGLAFSDDRLTPQAAIAKALRLSLSDEAAVDAAGDVVCALYRSGFAVVSRETAGPAAPGSGSGWWLHTSTGA